MATTIANPNGIELSASIRLFISNSPNSHVLEIGAPDSSYSTTASRTDTKEPDSDNADHRDDLWLNGVHHDFSDQVPENCQAQQKAGPSHPFVKEHAVIVCG